MPRRELGRVCTLSNLSHASISQFSYEGCSSRSSVGGESWYYTQVAQRPRAGAAGLTFVDLASFIDHRIDQQGGGQALQPLVDPVPYDVPRREEGNSVPVL